MRSAFDFDPLFRSTIGFDYLPSVLEAVSRLDQSTSGYPPYDIEKLDEDSYRISMAVAGFSADDLSLETREQVLYVTGQKPGDEEERTYLHHGIATRGFQRSFQLADHVKVISAHLDNGLLSVNLVREIPEEMRPRQVPIDTGGLKAIAAPSKKISERKSKAA
ncbi:MAG: Hsp20 family protein [Kiloniellales bacterium]|nr:Hsp20 family protein [Kiloniellales bacterium]